MLRSVASGLLKARFIISTANRSYINCNMPFEEHESTEDVNRRFAAYFNDPNLDGWDCRQGINLLAGSDIILDPQGQIAILKACRRLHDYAMAVRYLESVKDKANAADKKIYPYILEEIRPLLDELGINTPEELGYDKPELQMQNVFELPQ
ncbi:Cytochrome c oxidase subunit 5A [Blattella germanica]|nr:Cytochrome c oxidase subunit 5A [Blattella germanica]